MKRTLILAFLILFIFFDIWVINADCYKTPLINNNSKITKENCNEFFQNHLIFKTFKIGEPIMKKIEEVFGEPYDILRNNEGIGITTYKYMGLTIETDFCEGKDIFYGYEISSPEFETNIGIKVGDSIDEVSKYFNKNDRYDTDYLYMFPIKGNKYYSNTQYNYAYCIHYKYDDDNNISLIDVHIFGSMGE